MVQTTVRMPKKLYEQLKAIAKERGLTMNALIIQALWEIKQ